jgi:vacuolar-type H+-ATPase subunit H
MSTKTATKSQIKFISGQELLNLVGKLNRANVALCKLIDSHESPVKEAAEKLDEITDQIEEMADSVCDDEIEEALKSNAEKEEILDAARDFIDSHERGIAAEAMDYIVFRDRLAFLDKPY